MIVIIFGVAGVGKTTIGSLLARELGWKFYDGDDFHPAENVQKMKRGQPLTDQDRDPWLERLRIRIERSVAEKENALLACSALKRKYRDRLRVNSNVRFVFLRGDRDRVAKQLSQRAGHFFDRKLLDSQFSDLEEPQPAEKALTFEIGSDPKELAAKIMSGLRGRTR